MTKPRRGASRADARVERRRRNFVGRIEAAEEPGHKIGAGVDYLRAVLASIDITEAWRIADHITTQLVATARELEPKRETA